jgi:hypothetical protein
VPVAADLTLLDRLPLAGDVVPDLPPRLKARLFQAFDIAVLWNKPGSQATVRAEITETTLQAVPGILDPSQDGYHDTGTGQPSPWGIWPTPLDAVESHSHWFPGRLIPGISADCPGP